MHIQYPMEISEKLCFEVCMLVYSTLFRKNKIAHRRHHVLCFLYSKWHNGFDLAQTADFFCTAFTFMRQKKCQEWDHEDATMVIYAFDNGILTLQNCFFHFTHYNASYCSTADCCADCSSPSLSAERTSKISVIIGTPRKEAGMDVPCICSLESRRSTTPKCKIHLKGKENNEFFFHFFSYFFLLRSCENM